MRLVIYTAIFGGKDCLIEDQPIFNNVDYICFSDENLKSKTWKVIPREASHSDPCRSAKLYKIMPHAFLPEYEYSLWIDGTHKIKKDPTPLISEYLIDANFAAYDHNDPNISDPRNCIYQEAIACKSQHKDNHDLIDSQIKKYKEEGYPANNGLTTNMTILRRHNKEDVVSCMSKWWSEIENGSRRDQLSFNYIAWKNNFKFNYIKGNSRNNEYVVKIREHIK